MAEIEYLNRHRHGEITVASHPMQNRMLIRVSGEVDLATAGAVERALLRAEQSHNLVVLDLRETSFMDSTGVHMIVSADRRLRRRQGRLVLVHAPPPIR